jgi:hypothetical protein
MCLEEPACWRGCKSPEVNARGARRQANGTRGFYRTPFPHWRSGLCAPPIVGEIWDARKSHTQQQLAKWVCRFWIHQVVAALAACPIRGGKRTRKIRRAGGGTSWPSRDPGDKERHRATVVEHTECPGGKPPSKESAMAVFRSVRLEYWGIFLLALLVTGCATSGEKVVEHPIPPGSEVQIWRRRYDIRPRPDRG